MSQNIKAALANSPYVISHLLSNWQTWTNYSQRDCPSNLYFQHVGHFLPFLSFCQFFKGLQHSTNARFDTQAKPSDVRFEKLNHFQVWMKTSISSKKDGTCFGLFCVLGFTVFCALCAKRSRVSIKACKPPRHSCRCIPFQVAAKSCKAGKNTAGKRRQSVQNLSIPTFDSWPNILQSVWRL